MGFEQNYVRSNFLKVKEGKFYLNGEVQEYPFTGKIVSISYKDVDFKDAEKKRYCVIKFIDGSGTSYKLDINVETNNYSTLIGFLANKEVIDVTLPVTLIPVVEKKEGQKFGRGSILVTQVKNGETVKGRSFFTKATPHGQPEWKLVKVGSKTFWDKSEYYQFLEDFVTKELVTRITPDAPEPSAVPDVKPSEIAYESKTVVQRKEESADATFPPVEAEVVTKMPWD